MITAALISAAAPAAASLAANFLTSPRQSSAERELRRLSEYFKTQASTPYMQTAEAQSQMREVQKADDRNRRRTVNQGISQGATGEAKIAGHQAANEAKAASVNRIAGQAGAHKERMLRNHMGALTQAEQMRGQAVNEWQGQISNIVDGVSGAAGVFAQTDFAQKPINQLFKKTAGK